MSGLPEDIKRVARSRLRAQFQVRDVDFERRLDGISNDMVAHNLGQSGPRNYALMLAFRDELHERARLFWQTWEPLLGARRKLKPSHADELKNELRAELTDSEHIGTAWNQRAPGPADDLERLRAAALLAGEAEIDFGIGTFDWWRRREFMLGTALGVAATIIAALIPLILSSSSPLTCTTP